MSKSNSIFKKITSLFLSLVFAISSFAVVGFSDITAETAEAAVGDDYYLMVYFTGNNRTSDGNNVWNDPEPTMTQATRFAVSSDGIHFSALDKNRPAIIQEGGTQNSRDHYCFKGQDGKYYIIATDADYSDNDWGKECSNFVLWRSDDLLNWDETIIDLHNVPGMSNSVMNYAWAPQVIWDDNEGKYMVYFTLKDNLHTDTDYGYNAQMIYYMYASNLLDPTTWTEPECLYDNPASSIDADISYSPTDRKYYMFYKDETVGRKTICLAKSDNVNGPYTFHCKLNTSVYDPDNSLYGTGGLEGCQLYMVGNEYYLFADRYAVGGGAFAIYDLGTDLSAIPSGDISVEGEGGSPITTVEALDGFRNLSPRHGSVIHINKTQYEALIDKYTGSTDDDIRYDLTRKYSNYKYNTETKEWEWHRWTWDGYLDSNGHYLQMNARNTSNSDIEVPAGGGYASIKDSRIAVHGGADVLDFFPDDVYTISFNFTLDVASTSSGTVFALGNGSEDYLMLFGNGDIYYRGSGANTDTKMCTTSIKEGINYKFTFVSDGTYITVYKNGEKIGKAATTIDFPSSSDSSRVVTFGWSDTHQNCVTGTYYDLRFRDYAVGAGTVKSEYSPNLAYRYNEGIATYGDRNNISNVSSKVRINDYEGATNCHDVTISCMYNAGDNIGTGNGEGNPIFEVGSGGTGDDKTYLNLTDTGYIWYCWGDGTTNHYFDVKQKTLGTLSTNTWYHITVVIHWDEINERYLIKVFKNDEQTYSGTYEVTNYNSNYTVDKYFSESHQVWAGGGNSYWNNDGNAYIDDLRIYGSKNIDPEDLYNEYQEEYINEGYSDAATSEVVSYVQNNLESYDVDAETNAINTGSTERKAYYSGNVATGAYKNVLACTTDGENAHNNVWDNNNAKFKDVHYAVFYPNDIALLYDGVAEHKPALPVQLEMHCYSNDRSIVTVYCSNGSNGNNSANFKLAHYWTGYGTTWNSWVGTSKPYNLKDDPIDGDGKSEAAADGNSHIGYYPGWQWDFSFSQPKDEGTPSMFWNKLYYIGSGNNSTYLDTFTGSDTNMRLYAFSGSSGGDFTIPNATHNVYVINYKPVYDILKSSSPTEMPNGFGGYGIKQFYTAFIKGQEDNWTEDSLNQFYVAAYKVLTCNPVEYSESTYQSNFSGTASAAAAEIKEAVEEFNNINLVRRANFSTLDSKYTQANTVISTLGTNSQAKTTSSIRNLISAVNKSAFEPNDGTFDRANLAYNDYQDAIDAEADAINAKITALDTLADLDDFDEAYDEGRELLLSLDGKQAQYKGAAIQNLINAMTAGSTETYANADAETRLDYGQAVKTAADGYETDIENAVAALTTSTDANYIDVSAFNPAYNKITKLDKDAYNEGSSSISTAITGANAAVTYSTKSYGGATINVIADSVTQKNVNAATTTILSALTTSIKQYKIYASDGVTVSGNNGTYNVASDSEITAETALGEGHEGYKGKGTYGVKLTFDSGSADTAWYMSYDSSSANRSEQYLGFGQRVQTGVQGNLHVRAVSKSNSNPYKVTINRNYSDNSSTHGINSIDYAADTYTLPAAPAIAYYTFTNYTYNGNTYNVGDTITGINNNIVINANYTKAVDNAFTVKVSTTSGNGDVFGGANGQTAAYNTKIEGSDASAYAWVEVLVGGAEKLFYVGSDLTYFVTESITLKAITKAQYDAAGYTGVPAVKVKASGAVVSDAGAGKHKLTVTGQYVNNGYEILEYGVLVGKATSGTLTDDDMIVENSGTQEGYKILRAKSTKLVGANQFTIGVNLPASFTGDYKFRGYLLYKNGDQIETVYCDVVNSTI